MTVNMGKGQGEWDMAMRYFIKINCTKILLLLDYSEHNVSENVSDDVHVV